MNDLAGPPRKPEPTIHWLVRGMMWLLVALLVLVPLFIVLAPLFMRHAAGSSPTTIWMVLELTGAVCGGCVLGAGFLGTLAWRGHSSIRGVAWSDGHPVAPRLPWYARAWAGVVCAGTLVLLIAQLHRALLGDSSRLSTFSSLVFAGLVFWNLLPPLVAGHWSATTVRFASRLTMTPRELYATSKAGHDHRRGP